MSTPTPSKLFYKPGEMEEKERSRPKSIIEHNSPLLVKNLGQNSGSSISTLARISTWNSSFTRVQRKSFRNLRQRAVFKNGSCNVFHSQIPQQGIRYLQDTFTTLVDSQWRWTLISFTLVFFVSWFIFAIIWWVIIFAHGDFEDAHLPHNQEESRWTPCVINMYNFASCYLFSVETQHTTGYGTRTPTEECPEAMFVMSMQGIVGLMIEAFMVGIVFAKMTRPKLRTQSILFSKNAVICQRDGHLSLMFRVADTRKSHIIGARIGAQLIRPRRTKEGEVISNSQTKLEVNADGCDTSLLFIWPLTILHIINKDSPFYHLSASDILQEKFEIVVFMEGTVESTGLSTQARSSYLTTEIFWGHRFEPVVFFNKDRRGYEVNYSKFEDTFAVDTPLCSGAELAQFYKLQDVPDSANSDPLTVDNIPD